MLSIPPGGGDVNAGEMRKRNIIEQIMIKQPEENGKREKIVIICRKMPGRAKWIRVVQNKQNG